jgi:hypothetical protein
MSLQTSCSAAQSIASQWSPQATAALGHFVASDARGLGQLHYQPTPAKEVAAIDAFYNTLKLPEPEAFGDLRRVPHHLPHWVRLLVAPFTQGATVDVPTQEPLKLVNRWGNPLRPGSTEWEGVGLRLCITEANGAVTPLPTLVPPYLVVAKALDPRAHDYFKLNGLHFATGLQEWFHESKQAMEKAWADTRPSAEPTAH